LPATREDAADLLLLPILPDALADALQGREVDGDRTQRLR